MCCTSMLIVAMAGRRNKTDSTYTPAQKEAYTQGKKDGSKHGKPDNRKLNRFQHDTDKLDSYRKGVTKGKMLPNSNKNRDRKKIRKRKYQPILDQICMEDPRMQAAKQTKVRDMITHIGKVLQSSTSFKAGAARMSNMLQKAGDDPDQIKKCADNLLKLVKILHLRASGDAKDEPVLAMEALNQSIAASNQNIRTIRKEIYEKYIQNKDELEKIVQRLNNNTDDHVKIEGIEKEMIDDLKMMDLKDFQDLRKQYNQDKRDQSLDVSGSEIGLSDNSGFTSNESSPRTETLGSDFESSDKSQSNSPKSTPRKKTSRQVNRGG